MRLLNAVLPLLSSCILAFPARIAETPTWFITNFNASLTRGIDENTTTLRFDFHGTNPAYKINLSCDTTWALDGIWRACGENRALLVRATHIDLSLRRRIAP